MVVRNGPHADILLRLCLQILLSTSILYCVKLNTSGNAAEVRLAATSKDK